MWVMMQQEKPGDYVVATGETRSVREFVEAAFRHISIQIRWEGQGDNEIGLDAKSGKMLVKVNPKYYRPTEVVSIEY